MPLLLGGCLTQMIPSPFWKAKIRSAFWLVGWVGPTPNESGSVPNRREDTKCYNPYYGGSQKGTRILGSSHILGPEYT